MCLSQGVVLLITTSTQMSAASAMQTPSPVNPHATSIKLAGKVLSLASASDCNRLKAKLIKENQVTGMCVHLVNTVYKLPMAVKGVVLQFDASKLTVFYDSHGRVNFRELVNELYSIYKTRIWLQKVDRNWAGTNAPNSVIFQSLTQFM